MAKTDRLQSEQEHQRKAFEHYAAQRGRRSYKATAQAFDVSVSTVKLWSRSFDWKKRLGEREATVARQNADDMLESSFQDLMRNKKLVRGCLMRLAKSVADGKVKMQMGDVDRLIRLQSFLDGDESKKAWHEMTPEQLAQRFHWLMKNVSDEDMDRFIAEYKRLEESGTPTYHGKKNIPD